MTNARRVKRMAALRRKRNLRAARISFILIVGAFLVFSVVDYFIIEERDGETIRDHIIKVDLFLLFFHASLLALLQFARRFSKKYVTPILLLFLTVLIGSEVYLNFLSKKQGIQILMAFIMAPALVLHFRPSWGALLYAVITAGTCSLFLAGPYQAYEVLPPIGAVIVVSMILMIVNNRALSQTLLIREKNCELSRANRVTLVSLRKVEELKRRQDTDYFLTSLLIQPLSENKSAGERVGIEYVLMQKKKFFYHGAEREIGGDICISDNMELKGKSYVVFLNGDAMGKSIQGAGGALVLGAVFRAVIARTAISTEFSSKNPKEWLLECFEELQNVFVSFRGSMIVSVLLGLIGEESGDMYYINANHPWPVLYRNNEAKFIKEKSVSQKLGVEGLENEVLVRSLDLLPGDIFLVGSDGKDDILLGGPDESDRDLNEDENLFLECVLKGKGEIAGIEAALRLKGSLEDDFSLMRITYKKQVPT